MAPLNFPSYSQGVLLPQGRELHLRQEEGKVFEDKLGHVPGSCAQILTYLHLSREGGQAPEPLECLQSMKL